jgi:putative transposase
MRICIMPNTFTQIHIHAICAVKYRKAIIHSSWNERMHQYMTRVLQRNGHKMIAINSMPDHLHMLFGFRPMQALSELMRIVKSETSEWINKQKFTPAKFRWQEGYGAFSYARSQVPIVADYVSDQQLHHRKKTFLQEYEELLKVFEVDYNKQYIFNPLE